MEAVHHVEAGDQSTAPIARLHSRVILALDHFTPEERAAVDRAVWAFVRGKANATRLSDAEPFYLLRATPTLLAIVRYEVGQPTVIEDVVTQEGWDYMAHAS
jgi:hypothetical protein